MPLPFMGGMMTAGSPAVLPSAITLGASLDKDASASTITSDAVTITVPAGNSGVILFQNIVLNATSVRYRTNQAGVFSPIYDLTIATFANSDEIELQVAGCAFGGDGVSIDLIDQSTGTKIATANLYRV